MRVTKKYFFQIGTKIPYSEWPELIHMFMDQQGLSSQRFMYYFQGYLGYSQSYENGKPYHEEEYLNNLKSGSCARILKDCPELGEIRIQKGSQYGWPDYAYLSNIDGDPISETKILPLMKKIHRSYGFLESNLYFFDIDFFGNVIPFERDFSGAERQCKTRGLPVDKELLMGDQPYGSGIILHRDACAENYIEVSVDLLHNGCLHDPQPYFEALQKLLPKIKVTSGLNIKLSPSEKEEVEETNRRALTVLQQCRDFFNQQLSNNQSQNTFSSNYSLALPLKKVAKKYGYAYKRIYQNFVFTLEKRTPKGAVLMLEIVSGPSRYYLDFSISFQGVGFNHMLGGGSYCPTNQQTADAIIEHVAETISDFETAFMSSLDAFFPETPDWFIPTD